MNAQKPMVVCVSTGKEISTLGMTIEFEAVAIGNQSNAVTFKAFFIDQTNETVSEIKEINCVVGSRQKMTFTLNPKVSSGKECYLAVQSINDNVDELQQMIPFKVNVAFSSDFDFFS